MGRRWHIEHADGREWTDLEVFGAIPDSLDGVRDVAVNQWGEVYVICDDGWAYLDHEPGDMEVVWRDGDRDGW